MSKQSRLPAHTEPCCTPLVREPLTEDWAGDLARMFKALGDPVRLQLLSRVASHAGGEACVCDLSVGLDLTQPTISHHLKVLRETGLLECEAARNLGLLLGCAICAGPAVRGPWARRRQHVVARLNCPGGDGMTVPVSTPTAPAGHVVVVGKLSTLDRFLPVWIGVAMLIGLLMGRSVPGLENVLQAVQVDGISLPIAIGLLVMMYPVLAKVRYDRLDSVTGDRRLLVSSLLMNWVLGPALMFALAWLFLPDLPAYRTGLIIVGLARCIAMVIIWNDLACGDREAAAVLVALNSLFQVVAFAGLGWFYLNVLPGWLGLDQTGINASTWDIARSVLIFLGIPLLAGFLSRRMGEKARGRAWYEERFVPRVGPFALYGLLFTIVVLFALQGNAITSNPLDVARIAVPLLVYFAVMWGGGYALGAGLGLGYQRTTTLAFTAAGNNFELAIAVAIATFGVTSGQALAGVVGPLIEVPVLVGLVYVSLALRKRFTPIPA